MDTLSFPNFATATPVAPAIEPRPDWAINTLRRMAPISATEIADESLKGTQVLVSLLERIVAGERKRMAANHWAYDHARATALASVLKSERARLERAQCHA